MMQRSGKQSIHTRSTLWTSTAAVQGINDHRCMQDRVSTQSKTVLSRADQNLRKKGRGKKKIEKKMQPSIPLITLIDRDCAAALEALPTL